MSTVIKAGETLPTVTDLSPPELLTLAVQQGADVDKLGKLMDLRDRWRHEQARMAFYEAARAVQQEVPKIVKDRRNDQTKSNYATLEAINAQLVPVYSRHGFALTFSQGQTDAPGHIRIVCDVSHSAGHTEQRWVDLPLDGAGIQGTVNKTGVHATGSTLSYGRRYLTCMIFNISTGDDDDGQESGKSDVEKLAQENTLLKIHNETLRNWLDNIYVVRTCIATQQWQQAIEAWDEIPPDDQRALWLATTKGGILTTEERKIIKSDEWAQHRRDMGRGDTP